MSLLRTIRYYLDLGPRKIAATVLPALARVEAMQWDGSEWGANVILGWGNDFSTPRGGLSVSPGWGDVCQINVGGFGPGHTALSGDWVVRGIDGTFSRWSPEAFAAKHTLVTKSDHFVLPSVFNLRQDR